MPMSRRGHGERKWRLGRPKNRAEGNPEEGWKGAGESPIFRKCLWLGMIVAAVGAFAGLRYCREVVRKVPLTAKVVRERAQTLSVEEVEEKLKEAGLVARQFVGTGELDERLGWVRNPAVVRAHLGEYSEEARTSVGVVEREQGYSLVGGHGRAGFVIALPDERYRLLELIETGGGWRVDWDSYARYCSASWQDLRNGTAEEAEVRVFVSPGSYYNPPFAEQSEWTCFQLTSPDLPHRVFAYGKIGTLREAWMKALVLGAPKYRQHMTLQVVGREGLMGERLFEIVRVRAIGWVRGDEDVETEWRSK